MSLRKNLTELLPNLLPSDPQKAIKGTELIHLVKLKLGGSFSEASLRYHFSIMSCDPSSPIAKVEKGQGYYRRGASIPALSGAQEIFSQYQGFLDEMQEQQGAVDITMMRMGKFRSIVKKWYQLKDCTPFVFHEPFKKNAPISNIWKFPEMLLIDWGKGGQESQPELLGKLKKHLGIPQFSLQAARLRLQSTHAGFREDIFHTLSASIWAQGGELIYAAPIDDEALAESIRALAYALGIGVITFGLRTEILDELPRTEHIENAHPRETEAIMEKLDIKRISSCRSSAHIDWTTLEALRGDTSEIDDLICWLTQCIETGITQPIKQD